MSQQGGIPQGVRPAGGPAPSGKATLIFVLGLVGLLVCAPLGIVAWIMGAGERKKVKAGLVAPSGLLTAGWVMGIIATVLIVVWIVVLIVIIGGTCAYAHAVQSMHSTTSVPMPPMP